MADLKERAARAIMGSNQIVSEHRRFRVSSQADPFVPWWDEGGSLLILPTIMLDFLDEFQNQSVQQSLASVK